MEMVSFLLRGTARLQEPRLAALELGPPSPQAAYVETRPAYFDAARSIEDARCYDFVRLLPGNEVDGPAIIWTPITTVVVNPGQKATCDGYKNLVITW